VDLAHSMAIEQKREMDARRYTCPTCQVSPGPTSRCIIGGIASNRSHPTRYQLGMQKA